jgi:phage FluMu gp28-like protein
MTSTTATVSVSEAPQELSSGERKDALDLVDELQAKRSGARLRLEDVPHILLPYQARWVADLSPVRIGLKSRRIGWSWGAYAAEGALEAARPKPFGMDQLYMGYNREMAAEQIGDVAFFAKAYGLAASAIDVRRSTERRVIQDVNGVVLADEKKDITTYRVAFASGHTYEALSSNPFGWRGRQGHARIDEAAFHRDLAAVIDGAMAYLMWGGRVSIVSTVLTEDDAFWAYVREVMAGKLNWSLHTVTLDDALADGLYRRICLITRKDWSPEGEAAWREGLFSRYTDQATANAELLCIPRRGSGLYFSRLILEQCMVEGVPILRWAGDDALVTDPGRLALAEDWCRDTLGPVLDALPADQRSVYAQDFARSADLSPIRLFQEDTPGHWSERALIELRNLPFDVQAHIRDYILDRLPLLHGAGFDARGNGSAHAEQALQKYGARVVQVMATPAWYDLWFPKYRAMHEGRNIAIVKSEDVIADHRLVELSGGRPRMADGRVKGSDGLDRHGDTASAGVIACSVMLADAPPPEGAMVEEADVGETYEPLLMALRRRVRGMFGGRERG